MFHGAACPMVRKYKLTEEKSETLVDRALPCQECGPDQSLDLVFPEKYRNWAMVTEDPNSVLDALYKYDEANDNYYLTAVAQKLISRATKLDSDLEAIYNIEIIP